MTERFFYTVEYPHRWGSGPRMVTINYQYGPIESLEEAKELAESHRVFTGYNEERCVTTYGSFFKVPEKEEENA